MNLLTKILCLLFFGLVAENIFPQGQPYFSINGNINNSFTEKSFCTVQVTSLLKNNNSDEVLDSLICIYLSDNKTKLTYNYNNDLSLNYFTFADWFNGEWIISDKRTNTYCFEGYLESVLWEWFNALSGEWLNDAKDVYNYDSLGNRVLHLHLNFNEQEFVNDFKYESSYDSANNLVFAVNQDWIDSIWVNRSKFIYTYTPENVNDTALFQVWTNEQWINYQMNIFEYDEELNMISSIAKRWDGNNWLNFGRGTYEYDIYNNRVLEYFEIANNNNWENWFRIFYEYDDKNNLIHLFGEEWVGGQWVPEDEPLVITNPDGIKIGFLAKEIFLYYSPPTSVENENNIVNGFNLLQNYPNPFNPSTTIKYEIPVRSFVTLKVFDILGNEVVVLVDEMKETGSYEVKFDGRELSSGIYFYTLTSGNFMETKKLILLK
jgi:hypothetical protein